jgi:SHS2 domain-containing protein
VPVPFRGHEVLEHTADVGLRVWAPSLDELFAEAAVGLVAIMGHADAEIAHHERVNLEAPDRDALFVDWLSEALFLFDARGVVPRSVEARVSESPWRVEATIEGPDAAAFIQEGPAVKAVTYHGLEIAETGAGYAARVYLDI